MSSEQLRIGVLGPLEVLRGERSLELPPSRKTRALLGYLAATGRAHSRSALCDLFWQEVNDPRAGLRWALSKLRAVVDGDETRRIATIRDQVALDGTDAVVDLARVEAAVGADPGAASTDTLLEARRAFRGEFLEGLDLHSCHQYQAWCLGMRERLRTLHVAILEELTEGLRHDPEAALPHALDRLRLDLYSEGAYVTAMDVLHDLGRVDRGLEIYERCRRMLSDHLGTRPSACLEEARRRLTSVAGSGTPGGSAPTAAGGSRNDEISDALAKLPEPDGLPAIGPNDPPLVGRRGEMKALQALLRRAEAKDPGGVVLLTGEPGIGKTRLLRELVRDVRSSEGWVLSGQVFETEEVRPYGPWADMLRELPPPLAEAISGGGLPGFLADRGSDPPSEGPTERAQLFAATGHILRTMIEARLPGLVVLDDVQWLDASSAALLHYVVRTLDSTPLLIALAARTSEIEPGSATGQVVRSLDEEGRLHRIPLVRLDASDTGALVRAVDEALDPESIFSISEGNPLFALAVASSLHEGIPSIPTSLEEELGRWLERLEPDTLSLLPWAAALGRTFDVPTLVRVVEWPSHEIVDAIDRLERRGILRASGVDGYDFTHSLLRQTAYLRPSEPARRAIHRRIATALDELDRSEGRAPSAVAHHAELGGLSRLSARACIEAAEDSLWVFALDEAAELVERGIRQLERLPDETRIPLEMGLLRIHTFRSMQERRPRDVEARVERVVDEARTEGFVEVVATGHALLMELQYQRGAFEEAGRSSVRSAEVARDASPDKAIRSLAETSACLLLLDQAPEDARRLASEAFDLADKHGVEVDVVPLARALLHHHDGELKRASESFREVIRLGRRARDRWWECPALTRMTMVELERGEPQRALARAREIEELAERMGDEEEVAFARGLGAVAAVAAAQTGSGPSAGSGSSAMVSGGKASGPQAETPNLADVDDALQGLRELDSLWKLAHVQAWAAEMELERVRPAAARTRAKEVLEVARSLRQPSLLALARGLLAYGAVLDEDKAEARRQLDSLPVTRPHHRLSHRARGAVERAREAISG